VTPTPGRFNDGRSAASHKVMVASLADRLEIRGEDGLLLAAWRSSDLVRDGEAPGGGIRLRCRAEPDARLTVARTFPLPGGASPARKWHVGWGLPLALAAGLAVMVGFFLALPGLARQGAALVPPALEVSWGAQVADGLERQMGRCQGLAGQAALDGLVRRLAAGLPGEHAAITVRVLNRPLVNAIALPGGQIIVFRGLLDLTQRPDELAGVLAHELTHIGERHVTAAMIRGAGVGVLATMLTGDASGALASGAAMVFASSYSRDDEAAADRGGLGLLARAGIGNAGFATFFERMEERETKGDVLPTWISSHPETAARLAVIRAAATATPLPAALGDEHWRAVKGICARR